MEKKTEILDVEEVSPKDYMAGKTQRCKCLRCGDEFVLEGVSNDNPYDHYEPKSYGFCTNYCEKRWK